MKRLSIVLVVMAFATACIHKPAPAEETSGIPDEVINQLDSFVGNWESEGKIGDKERTGRFNCRWARTDEKEKICLIGEFSYKTGEEVRSGVTLVGWNTTKKCIEDRSFNALGGNATLLWKMESPTHWRGDIIMEESGETTKAKADLIKKSDTEFVMEAEYDNGDVARSVYRKVKRERKKKDKE